MRFVDTNILLYAVSAKHEEAVKAQRAVELLDEPELALSVQVLQEFYVQATRPKGPSAISHEQAVAFLGTLRVMPTQQTTVDVFRAALAAKARWQLSYWDAAIIEAARALGCDTVFTEDLQDGQDFDGVWIRNPFVS